MDTNKRWYAAAKRLPKDKKIKVAEVGVWYPKFSKAFIPMFPLCKFYMIDRWCVPPKNDSYLSSQSEISERPQKDFDKALAECRLIEAKYKNQIVIYKMDSVEAAKCFEDYSLDLVFIDGDHSYNGCKRDIQAYLSKVKKGGWLGGHDYNHPDQGEVKKAVDEFVKERGLKLELDVNRTWWVRI